MKYFATWWGKSDKRTYAQLLDEKPDDEFEEGKEDFYSEEFDDSDEEELERSAKNVRYIMKDVFDDVPEDISRFISELRSGAKIELDDYNWS